MIPQPRRKSHSRIPHFPFPPHAKRGRDERPRLQRDTHVPPYGFRASTLVARRHVSVCAARRCTALTSPRAIGHRICSLTPRVQHSLKYTATPPRSAREYASATLRLHVRVTLVHAVLELLALLGVALHALAVKAVVRQQRLAALLERQRRIHVCRSEGENHK